MTAKVRFLAGGLTILALLLIGIGASAEWRIDIESKVVNVGKTGVTVDFTGYWELSIWGLTVPIVVREIDPGAFWTGSLPVDTTSGVVVGVQWNWEVPDWATLIQQIRPGLEIISEEEYCGEGDPGRDTEYNGVPPDNLAIMAYGIMVSEPAHPDGRVFLTLTFDVTGVAGSFEFDTACFNLSQMTIFIVGSDLMDHGPTGPLGDFDGFNKGVITIFSTSCDCGVWGDVNDDGNLNPVDIVYMVNYVYLSNDMRVQPPACPNEAGDVNCDGTVNPVDVVLFVNRVYLDIDMFCADPCGICIPPLVTPQPGTTLDNGCHDFSDPIIWDFDWMDCPGATSYHLYVIGPSAGSPLIDNQSIPTSSFHYEDYGWISDTHLDGWSWKVRAKVDGVWGVWSPERTFDVEPVNTDCPGL